MCTLIGKTSGCQPPFLASTSDDPYSTRNQVIADTGPTGLRFLAVVAHSLTGSVPWDGMITRGLNDAGLAFTYSFVEPATTNYGTRTKQTSPADFSYQLLTECSNTDEATKFLHGGVPSGCTGNYLLLDATGNLVVVEAATTVSRCFVAEQVVRTNTWTAPSLPPLRPSIYSGQSSAHRAARAKQLLERIHAARDVAAILSDHSGSGKQLTYDLSICNHGSTDGTTSAEILIPAHRILLYTYGRPCGQNDSLPSWGHYREFSLKEAANGQLTDLAGSVRPSV
jgi:hypothetical protein